MKPYLNNVSGKSNSDIITLNGGLNTCYDKSFINDNQFPFMWNVGLNNSPTLATRSNRLSIAWHMEDKSLYATGKVLASFSSSSEKYYTIEDKRTTDNPDADSYIYKYEVISNMIEKIYVGKVAFANKYSIVECRDSQNKYIVISTPSQRYQFTETDGTTSTELITADDNISGVLAYHKNRLFVGKGTSLKFSNLRQYNNFTIDSTDPENTAGEINVTNAQGNITAIIPYDGKLFIFCERSRHILYGTSPNSDIDQFYLVDLDDGIGCISNTAVAICDRRLVWVDNNTDVYMFDGSYLKRISEPYSYSNYSHSDGGIKGITLSPFHLDQVVVGGYYNFVYICGTTSIETDNHDNNIVFVYDLNNKVWWTEDGDFTTLTNWKTHYFDINTEHLIGTKYNGDSLVLNKNQKAGTDMLFNTTTRDFDEQEIEYSFETKTWLLNRVKNKKTLTTVWFEANANADVAVGDYWTTGDVWNDTFDSYLPIGKLIKHDSRHDILAPTKYYHEGFERQQLRIPHQYIQKVNAFSLRVKGKGYGEFFLLEKEWRVK